MKRFWKSVFVYIILVFFLASSALAAINLPITTQNDPRWKHIQYAQNPNITIGGYGCALTSMCMILNYYGFLVDPPTLNYWMIQNGGYAYDSETGYNDLVVWSTIPKYTNGLVQNIYNTSVDNELSQNRPVIAQVHSREIPMHFVVITGKNGNGYEINDPLDTQKTSITTKGYFIDKFIFYQGPIPSPPPPPQPTPPEKIKTKPQKKKAVVILVNGGKDMVPFANELKQKAKFIVDSVEDEASLHSAVFRNSTEWFSHEPVIIKGDKERSKIKKDIDSRLDPTFLWLSSLLTGVDHDSTLQAALKVLQEPGIQNRDRIIYLITNGSQTRNLPESLVQGPKLGYQDTHKKIKEEGIKLKIIGVGNINQDFLQKVANESGGELEIVQKERKISLLLIPWKQKELRYEKFFHLMLNQVVEDEIEILHQDFYSVFSFLWTHTKLEITITDPKGKEITGVSNVSLVQDPSYSIYKIKTPQPGKYKVRIKAVEVPPEGEDIQFFAASQADRTPPKISLLNPRKKYKKKEILFKLRVEDDLTKTKKVAFGFSKKTNEAQKWQWTSAEKKKGFWEAKWQPKKSGEYILGFVAYDEFGNSGTLRKDVVVKLPKSKNPLLSSTLWSRIINFFKKLLGISN